MRRVIQQDPLFLTPSPLSHSHRREENSLRRRTVDVQRDLPHSVLQPVGSLGKAGQHVHHLLLFEREAILRRGGLGHELLVLLDESDDGAADIATNAFDEFVGAVFERFFDETQSVLVDERHRGNGACEESIQRTITQRSVAERKISSWGMEIERRDLLSQNEKRFDAEKLAIDEGLARKNRRSGSRNGNQNGTHRFGCKIGHNRVLHHRTKASIRPHKCRAEKARGGSSERACTTQSRSRSRLDVSARRNGTVYQDNRCLLRWERSHESSYRCMCGR